MFGFCQKNFFKGSGKPTAYISKFSHIWLNCSCPLSMNIRMTVNITCPQSFFLHVTPLSYDRLPLWFPLEVNRFLLVTNSNMFITLECQQLIEVACASQLFSSPPSRTAPQSSFLCTLLQRESPDPWASPSPRRGQPQCSLCDVPAVRDAAHRLFFLSFDSIIYVLFTYFYYSDFFLCIYFITSLFSTSAFPFLAHPLLSLLFLCFILFVIMIFWFSLSITSNKKKLYFYLT